MTSCAFLIESTRLELHAMRAWMFVLLPLASWGQSDTGTITGIVRDSSAAVIARVKITVTDIGANAEVFSATTDAAGRYTAPALRPADYVLTAEAPGFKKDVRRGLNLQVNQGAVGDFTLEVGQVTEVLEVNAAAPLSDTQSAGLRDVD